MNEFQNRVMFFKNKLTDIDASMEAYNQLNANGVACDGALQNGRLYVLDYFDDVYRKKKKLYDTHPIVLGLGQSTKNHEVSYGINLHVMPPDIRTQFINDVYTTFKKHIEINIREYDADSQHYIPQFTFKNVFDAFEKVYHISKTIISCDITFMESVKVLNFFDWCWAAFENEDFFDNGSLFDVQKAYLKSFQ